MTPFRPTSYDRPGEQISTTPSGLRVTSAKRFAEVTFNPEGVVDICSPGRSYEVGLNGVI